MIFLTPFSSDIDRALMMHAIVENNVAMATRILDRGFDVNHIEPFQGGFGKDKRDKRDKKMGMSLLHLLISEGDFPEMAKLFVARGIDVDRLNGSGYTPLIHCLYINRIETIQVLLGARANPKTPDKEGHLLLDIAKGYLDAPGARLLSMLLDAGASLNEFEELRNDSFLCACVKKENMDCIRVLLARGEDPRRVVSSTQESALDMAKRRLMEGTIQVHPCKLSSYEINLRREIFCLLKSWLDAKIAIDEMDKILNIH